METQIRIVFHPFQFELFFAGPSNCRRNATTRVALPNPKSCKNKSTTGSILTLHCQWSVKTQQKQKNKSQEQSVTRMWVSGAERCDEFEFEWCTFWRSPACGATTFPNRTIPFPPNST